MRVGFPVPSSRDAARQSPPQRFFEDSDYELYLDFLSDAAARSEAAIWSYCLMPNHVHIIAVPSDEEGLRRTFRFVHRHYSGYINTRLRMTGYLWQGQFGGELINDAVNVGLDVEPILGLREVKGAVEVRRAVEHGIQAVRAERAAFRARAGDFTLGKEELLRLRMQRRIVERCAARIAGAK